MAGRTALEAGAREGGVHSWGPGVQLLLPVLCEAETHQLEGWGGAGGDYRIRGPESLGPALRRQNWSPQLKDKERHPLLEWEPLGGQRVMRASVSSQDTRDEGQVGSLTPSAA